ncbi:unnamed protein product [Cyprideis torosa]|uniref:Uncharacterized protein n=1 Tax=Cyprideis torosa TaxID=163714 RepID=A0A7R8WC80_9CRUS|nr:unnamed protein product [Cyprideis torosa]CAG0893017.1 unnamed protein product [Cyprideis torosa]
MKREVESAAGFLVNILRLNERSKEVHPQLLDFFRSRLAECLRKHYTNHWFPEMPFRGSGYRCIRINGRLDPVIAQAGKSCGIPDAFLYSLFPTELTLWVDPKEVSYRIGENGSVCVLYSADNHSAHYSTSPHRQPVNVYNSHPLQSPSPPMSPSRRPVLSSPGHQQHQAVTIDSACGKEARRKLIFAEDAQNVCRVETS